MKLIVWYVRRETKANHIWTVVKIKACEHHKLLGILGAISVSLALRSPSIAHAETLHAAAPYDPQVVQATRDVLDALGMNTEGMTGQQIMQEAQRFSSSPKELQAGGFFSGLGKMIVYIVREKARQKHQQEYEFEKNLEEELRKQISERITHDDPLDYPGLLKYDSYLKILRKCRTPADLQRILDHIEEWGIQRDGVDGFTLNQKFKELYEEISQIQEDILNKKIHRMDEIMDDFLHRYRHFSLPSTNESSDTLIIPNHSIVPIWDLPQVPMPRIFMTEIPISL
ncbi:hypothetical protein DNHGIG_40290 [Collibacillus ludicampi]|uniref:Uncharacterized protein n=1 Tax=Collibacillus ludicampi TaxID=2771369 RepID=A0AAV4LL68_9BACL|nr:hypothetical protein [Collibacillus ludicampi]GIM48480.1 hypothetical protein DNHGIG_40290 [Collibacillus ludicampi]